MVNTVTYQGELWQAFEHLPHPDLLSCLQAKNQLVILQHGLPPYQVVLGAPHHVPSGVWRICQERLDKHGQVNDRCGDDNVASYALVAFSRLQALDIPSKLVIMSRSTTHDPNKVLHSPYCQEIFREESELLFECHASGGQRHFELELSSGSNTITQTVRFGRTLSSNLAHQFLLGVQAVPAQKDALIFKSDGQTMTGQLQLPAIRTTSLQEAGRRGVPALHLEAKPKFRIVRGVPDTVSPTGQVLGQAVAQAIAQLQGQVRRPTLIGRTKSLHKNFNFCVK